MSYRGHDLDLRPQRAGPPREETIRAMPRPSREPIAVDPATLDCCNAAFDLARAHGAREVRLEHLLHALARVPAASGLLEEAGIRPDRLRRTATMAMADEGQSLAHGTVGEPVASAAFEDMLRHAAGEADTRRSPATLPDMLRALLDSPAATLLQGASDPQRLARWREMTGRTRLSVASAFATHRPAEQTPAADEAVLARLGTLETAIQSLEARLGDTSAIEAKLDELGRAVTALAERPAASTAESSVADGALASQVADRMAHAETSLLELQEQAERHWTAAKQRQDTIEASLRTQAAKVEEARKSQEQAVGDIQHALLKLGADQRVLGNNFAAWRSETGGDLGIISSRLEQLDRAALNMLEQLSVDLRMRSWTNGLDATRLRENLKRVLHSTGSVIASGWRREAPNHVLHPPEHGDADQTAVEDRSHLPRA